MKRNNLMHIVILNMRVRKNQLIVSSILLVSTLLILLSGFNLSFTIKKFLNDVVYEIPLVKTLYFHLPNDRQAEAIKAIENEIREGRATEGSYLRYGIFGFLDYEQLVGGLTVNTYNQGYEHLISTESTLDKNDMGIIILPEHLLSNAEIPNNIINTDQPQFIDGTTYIGSTIKLRFVSSHKQNEITKEYRVVGTYDNSLSFDDPGNALVSSLEMDSLIAELGIEQADFSTFYIIAKDMNQVEAIKKSVRQQLSLKSDVRAVFNYDTLINFMAFSRFITLFIGSIFVLCSAVYISMSTIKNIDHRKTEIGVLKVVGYNSNQIKKVFITENIFVTSVSVCIAFLLHLTSILFMNLTLDKFGHFHVRSIHFRLYPMFVIFTFLILYMIVHIISVWKVKKIDALESIDILKSR